MLSKPIVFALIFITLLGADSLKLLRGSKGGFAALVDQVVENVDSKTDPTPPATPPDPYYAPPDTPPDGHPNPDPLFRNREGSPSDGTRPQGESPLVLPDPTNVTTVYELTPDGRGFLVRRQVGGQDVEPPSYISYEDFQRRQDALTRQDYFRNQNLQSGRTANQPNGANNSNSLIPQVNVNSRLFETIFGSTVIDIKPNVSVLLDLSMRRNRLQNPNLTLRQQRNTSFNFDQQIQLNVVGQIGERLKLNVNFDTEATFQFENQFKIGFNGDEDAIMKRFEAGNVSMPLNGTLIQGGQNLWGLKTEMQFGPVFVTALASQQRGRSEEINVSGGGQQTPFDLKASDYDFNRHFFLNHWFRSLYEQSLERLPTVNSPFNITRIEVWVTNRNSTGTTSLRNAIGFVDLAEADTTPSSASRGGTSRFWNPARVQYNPNAQHAIPDNNANTLYPLIANNPQMRDRAGAIQFMESQGFENSVDFELIENIRPLNPNEYTLNPALGFISLNTRLNPNDVLYVSYEYTVAGSNTVYRVGEFSQDQASNQNNTNVLFLKTLKPSSIRPRFSGRDFPTWDLMMKNVYAIGGLNLQPEGFRMEIIYASTEGSGDINYLPTSAVANTPLVQVFGIDQLTNNNERGPDNIFDFIPGVTVLPDKGVIIFPELEPFGNNLAERMNNDQNDVGRYVFNELYRMTQVDAVQYYPQKDRFRFRGSYQGSSGSEIYLNSINVAPGSIRVTAGGVQLQEGTDYTVDYQIGKVTIINPGYLASGQDIKVKFESNTLFGIDQKTLLGTRIEFRRWRDFTVGGTLMHLNERPLINKINIGDEPVSNTIWGLDATFRRNSRFLTRLADLLPFHSTDAPSEFSFQGEFANLRPGSPRQIRTSGENGIAYLDDFEGARNTVDMSGMGYWKLASRPASVPEPAGDSLNDGYTRARLAWYQIDPIFYDQRDQFGINDQDATLLNPYSRKIHPHEVFPNRTIISGSNILTTFDFHYFPTLRGQYNYQTSAAKLNPDGTFTTPRENWAGVMRRTTGNTDFEAANFEFIEFWVMDPFLDGSPNGTGLAATGGDLYINLGKVSEDVLPDNRRAYENGLPLNEADNNGNFNLDGTPYGRVSNLQVPTTAFSNDQTSRQFQDVGLDGLGSGVEVGGNTTPRDEQSYFADFLGELSAVLTPDALAVLQRDPSSDDFTHFRDEFNENDRPWGYPKGTGIIERYFRYNGNEGNSPLNREGEAFTRSSNAYPDVEDINADGTLNSAEQYFEYRVSLRPGDMNPGQNYIVDRRDTTIELTNGTQQLSTWYLFRVPIRSGARSVGGIQDFKSIDFIRMYVTGWEKEVVLRFAKLELVSTTWRSDNESEYIATGDTTGEPDGGSDLRSVLELGTLNIEENGQKQPFNYVLPPGIERQQQVAALQNGLLLNEQSLVMKVTDLANDRTRGAFRRFNLDLRNYEKLKLWVHAEALDECPGLGNFTECGDANLVIRLGSDFSLNYYEYEIPLCPPANLGSSNDRENIWQDVEIILEQLSLAKQRRNDAGFSLSNVYSYEFEPGKFIRVVGTPMISQVQAVWIGIRNPRPQGANEEPVCLELWVNELRATDFNNRPSWAANARLNLRIADFMTVQASAFRQTAYFGSVEQRVNQRSLDEIFRYDVAVNINAGLLLPKALRLDLPVFLTYGEQTIVPIYNPIDPDITLNAAVAAQETDADGERKFQESITYIRAYSYSFNNVRIRPGPNQQNPMPWNISNFTLSYGYNERFLRNAQIAYQTNQQYRGAIQYTYTLNAKSIQPFKNLFGAGARNLITEFNFSLLPKQFSFRIEGDRQYEERQLRSLSNNLRIDPTFSQNFLINRQYNMRWDLARSLGLNYTATVVSRVDEPRGRIEGERQDTLWNNVVSLGRDLENPFPKYHQVNVGRTLNFNQQIQLTYRVPFNYIKPLDWITATANYNADLRWISASLDNASLGNQIANTRNITFNGQFNLGNFYRKFPVVQRILKPIPRRNIYSRTDSTRREDDDPYIALKRLGKMGAGWLFSVQSLDFNYTMMQSTNLAGYMPRADNFGLDFGFQNPFDENQSSLAPGIPFMLGEQPDLSSSDWLLMAAMRGWFTRDDAFFTPFQQADQRQFQARTSIELFKGFRVDINVTKQTSQQRGGLWRYDSDTDDFVLSNPATQGMFTMSFLSMGSIFQGDDSPAFVEFEQNNRRLMSERLAFENPNYVNSLGGLAFGSDGLAARVVSENPSTNDYYNGYTGSSQDVLMPSFLAAYGPYKANKIALSPFPAIPLPNWQVNYNGLTSLQFLRDVFTTVTIRHGYRSTYSTNYLLNNRSITDDGFVSPDGFTTVFSRIDTGFIAGTNGDSAVSIVNFEPAYTIGNVTINEAFQPLIGINLQFKNGIGAQIDFKRSRILMLNVGALQLNENRNTELTVNLSWRKEGSLASFQIFGRAMELKNTFTVRFETTLRNTVIQNRRLDNQLPPDATGGTFNLTIKPSIDYMINTQLSVRLYVEHTRNRPQLSTSFPSSYTAFGLQVRFTLSSTL